MRCDFCGSPTMARWSYPLRNGERRLACDRCRAPIEREDREELLGRVLLAPVPRTVRERYTERFRAEAKRLHHEFWELRAGGPRPLEQ
jgi:hypothetical protein